MGTISNVCGELAREIQLTSGESSGEIGEGSGRVGGSSRSLGVEGSFLVSYVSDLGLNDASGSLKFARKRRASSANDPDERERERGEREEEERVNGGEQRRTEGGEAALVEEDSPLGCCTWTLTMMGVPS